MRIRMLSGLLMLLSISCGGCGTRHIYQQPGTATLLQEPIKGAKIAAPDKDGNLVPGTADIPAGAVIVVPREAIK